MSDPLQKEFLLCAYLGARFKTRAEVAKVSYEKQASEIGMNKQNLLAVANEGTVGGSVLISFSERLFDDSFDAMTAAARNWWSGLSEERREALRAWASNLAEKRPRKDQKGRKLAEESASRAKSRGGDGGGKRRGMSSVRGTPKGN